MNIILSLSWLSCKWSSDWSTESCRTCIQSSCWQCNCSHQSLQWVYRWVSMVWQWKWMLWFLIMLPSGDTSRLKRTGPNVEPGGISGLFFLIIHDRKECRPAKYDLNLWRTVTERSARWSCLSSGVLWATVSNGSAQTAFSEQCSFESFPSLMKTVSVLWLVLGSETRLEIFKQCCHSNHTAAWKHFFVWPLRQFWCWSVVEMTEQLKLSFQWWLN